MENLEFGKQKLGVVKGGQILEEFVMYD